MVLKKSDIIINYFDCKLNICKKQKNKMMNTKLYKKIKKYSYLSGNNKNKIKYLNKQINIYKKLYKSKELIDLFKCVLNKCRDINIDYFKLVIKIIYKLDETYKNDKKLTELKLKLNKKPNLIIVEDLIYIDLLYEILKIKDIIISINNRNSNNMNKKYRELIRKYMGCVYNSCKNEIEDFKKDKLNKDYNKYLINYGKSEKKDVNEFVSKTIEYYNKLAKSKQRQNFFKCALNSCHDLLIELFKIRIKNIYKLDKKYKEIKNLKFVDDKLKKNPNLITIEELIEIDRIDNILTTQKMFKIK